MGLADRDYMRERRNRGTLHSLRTNSLPSWLKAFVWIAVLGLLFVGCKYFLEREKAQPFPPTGAARWYIQTGGQATAPLTIKAPIRSGLHHVVRLDEWHSGKPVVLIPIRAGETASLHVPLGRYRVTMANGSRWLGAEKLFGMASEVKEAIDPMEFYATPTGTTGHNIDLAGRLHGNMPTKPAGLF